MPASGAVGPAQVKPAVAAPQVQPARLKVLYLFAGGFDIDEVNVLRVKKNLTILHPVRRLFCLGRVVAGCCDLVIAWPVLNEAVGDVGPQPEACSHDHRQILTRAAGQDFLPLTAVTAYLPRWNAAIAWAAWASQLPFLDPCGGGLMKNMASSGSSTAGDFSSADRELTL